MIGLDPCRCFSWLKENGFGYLNGMALQTRPRVWTCIRLQTSEGLFAAIHQTKHVCTPVSIRLSMSLGAEGPAASLDLQTAGCIVCMSTTCTFSCAVRRQSAQHVRILCSLCTDTTAKAECMRIVELPACAEPVLCESIAVHKQSKCNASKDTAQKIVSSLEQGSIR